VVRKLECPASRAISLIGADVQHDRAGLRRASRDRADVADPGLGMNRAPDRLYVAVVVVLCSCRLRARGERRCVLLFRTWRSSAKNPARALMARDVLVRSPEIDSYGSLNLGKPVRGVHMSEA
jgi:hypothetical protein